VANCKEKRRWIYFASCTLCFVVGSKKRLSYISLKNYKHQLVIQLPSRNGFIWTQTSSKHMTTMSLCSKFYPFLYVPSCLGVLNLLSFVWAKCFEDFVQKPLILIWWMIWSKKQPSHFLFSKNNFLHLFSTLWDILWCI
jgi:hypothetical protein